MCICEYGELHFKLADLTGVAGQAARVIMPSTLNLIMSTCTFKVKLSDGQHDELRNEYSIVVKDGTKQATTADKALESQEIEADAVRLEGEEIQTSFPSFFSSSSPSSSTSKGVESIIVCGFAKGRAKSILSWIVSVIWAKVVASGAIFEIWLLLFNLFLLEK